jgi:hypothetical protein
MDQNIFNFTKNVILNGMPTGMLVTKGPININVGHWQTQTYDHNIDIWNTLKTKICPVTINILEFDDSMTYQEASLFINQNKFELIDRRSFFVYCIIVNKLKVDNSFRNMMASNEFQMDKFETEIITDGYSIFINNLMKNILYI